MANELRCFEHFIACIISLLQSRKRMMHLSAKQSDLMLTKCLIASSLHCTAMDEAKTIVSTGVDVGAYSGDDFGFPLDPYSIQVFVPSGGLR